MMGNGGVSQQSFPMLEKKNKSRGIPHGEDWDNKDSRGWLHHHHHHLSWSHATSSRKLPSSRFFDRRPTYNLTPPSSQPISTPPPQLQPSSPHCNNSMRSMIAHGLLLFSLASLHLSAHAQTCDTFQFPDDRSFARCSDLGRLNAYLHWTYRAETGTVVLAFRALQGSDGYIAWGLNPTKSGMIGAQTLVALQNSTNVMWSYTTNIDTRFPDMKPATLSTVSVAKLSAELRGGYKIIYATVTLPENKTTLNHVWQVSDQVSNGLPSGHGSGNNLLSSGSIDFLGGTSTSGSEPRARRKNVHGFLNAVAWGILMPIGAILARYLRVFESADPAWFYLHVACQCTAYGLGVAGWATGLKLGSDSAGITHTEHRRMGIALFCMATLQVFALLLRPDKKNKYRFYWNIYHRGIGYGVIILSVVNIFEGFDILNREKNWKNAYIGIIITLACIALVLELVTWVIVLRRKNQKREEKSHPGDVGGRVNGYDPRVV